MTHLLKVIAAAGIGLAFLTSEGPAMAAGAVVVSPDRGVVFWATRKPSEKLATDAAMSNCARRFGEGCLVERTYGSGCLSIARSPSHRRWAYALRPAAKPAQEAALASCASGGGPICRLQTTTCE